MLRTRFAPSPSGDMHIGHLYAAWEARQLADQCGGECLLRMEDIDARCKPEYREQALRDLEWLGLHFDGEIMIQSQRLDIYRQALEQLHQAGVLYPCFCTRKEIQAQVQESGRAPHSSLGYQYEGKCRQLHPELVAQYLAEGRAHAWRLDMRRCQDLIGCPTWHDSQRGTQICTPSAWGDVVVARKEVPTSYHLCVVVDDAAQGISHVTRGEDLFDATAIHRCLQALLQVPTPLYSHHALLRDSQGKRLAKRDGARSIAHLREEGWTPSDLRRALARSLDNGGIWHESAPPPHPTA